MNNNCRYLLVTEDKTTVYALTVEVFFTIKLGSAQPYTLNIDEATVFNTEQEAITMREMMPHLEKFKPVEIPFFNLGEK